MSETETREQVIEEFRKLLDAYQRAGCITKFTAAQKELFAFVESLADAGRASQSTPAEQMRESAAQIADLWANSVVGQFEILSDMTWRQ